MYPNERARLAAEQFINRAREPKLRNEGEVWQLTAAQIERQEQGTADDLSYAIRWMGKSYPACLNPDAPCQQGDKLCPTPEECRLPERREPSRLDNAGRNLMLGAIAGLMALFLVAYAAVRFGT